MVSSHIATKLKVLVVIFLSVMTVAITYSNILNAQSIKTIKGNIRVFGTGEVRIYNFITEDGERYQLEDGVLSELKKIKQFDLIITGKIDGKVMVPTDYRIDFDKTVKKAEDAVILGKLYSFHNNLYIITEDQYVIKLEKNTLSDLEGHKILAIGKYKRIGEYIAKLKLDSYIDLKEDK